MTKTSPDADHDLPGREYHTLLPPQGGHHGEMMVMMRHVAGCAQNDL